MGETDDRGRHSATLVAFSISISGLLLVASVSVASAEARPVRYIRPYFLETPRNITVKQGRSAVLPCSVENLGTKSVTWRKVSKKNALTIGTFVFDPDKRYGIVRDDLQVCPHYRSEITENPCWNLRIRNVQIQHAGTYECHVSTQEDFMRSVTLRVIEDHSPKRKKMAGITLNGTNYVEVGARIDLNCTARTIDYRPKGVDWFKDGSRIKSGNRSLITEFILSETNVLHSRLQIDRAIMFDAGTYVCRFSSEDVQSLKVIVLNTNTNNHRRDMSKENRHTQIEASRPREQGPEDSSVISSPSYVIIMTLSLCACLVSRHSS